MGWIKRNLLFVVVGVLALAALGAAGFYIYESYANNSTQAQALTEIYDTLVQLNQKQPQPGTNNTDRAKEQERQLRDWINQAAGYFHPIPPIPSGEVTSKTFATALGTTIYELTQEAKENSVSLPPQYCFSFQVQNNLLSISSGLAPLAQQLGEVKAISEVLFAARVNSLDSIQRVRVSEDDATKGLQSDYVDKSALTNELAIITPYVVTFRSFTPELARVITAFSTSTNPFIVKSVSVQPAGSEGAAENPAITEPAPYRQLPYQPGGRYSPRYQPQRPVEQPPANGPVSGKGGLQTVIKEQLLRVTVEVDIVKLLLKS